MSATYANLFCVVRAAAPICCRAASGFWLCTSHILPFLLAFSFDQIWTTSSTTSNLNGKANCTFMGIAHLRRKRTMHINFHYVLFWFFSRSKRRTTNYEQICHRTSHQSNFATYSPTIQQEARIDFISDSDVHPPLLLQFDISSRPLFLNRLSLVEILLFHCARTLFISVLVFYERRNYVHAKNVNI